MSSVSVVRLWRARLCARHRRLSVLVLAMSLILAAACGSDQEYGDDVELSGGVFLDCNQECQDYGSCGVTKESGEKVLLIGAQPAFPHVSSVEFRGLVNRTQVEVQASEVVSGVLESTGEEVAIRFYLVQQPEADIEGWIPGFCVARSRE